MIRKTWLPPSCLYVFEIGYNDTYSKDPQSYGYYKRNNNERLSSRIKIQTVDFSHHALSHCLVKPTSITQISNLFYRDPLHYVSFPNIFAKTNQYCHSRLISSIRRMPIAGRTFMRYRYRDGRSSACSICTQRWTNVAPRHTCRNSIAGGYSRSWWFWNYGGSSLEQPLWVCLEDCLL